MSTDVVAPMADPADCGALGPLPRVSRRAARLAAWARRAPAMRALSWLAGPIAGSIEVGEPEVLERGSGLGKPGVIARLAVPGRAAAFGLGLETQLAHALIDRLLGFERGPGEERLPLTAVEWGLMGFVVTRSLAASSGAACVLDRVGPDPFVPVEPTMTVRWPLRVGAAVGSLRLWLPIALAEDLARTAAPPAAGAGGLLGRYGALGSTWRALGGAVTLQRGLGRLRVGGVLPIDGAPLRGTAAAPAGPVALELRQAGSACRFAAELRPATGPGRLVLTSALSLEPTPREALTVSTPIDPDPAPAPSPAEVPVTLTVELGRVNLPLHRLADLKPGDVLELGRHAREPVELTSNGRLVARGELVQIDIELGVRITNVLM